MSELSNTLSKIVQAVQTSRKYRQVHRDVIVFVAKQELRKRNNLKEATKATKNKLHQIAGAYFNRKPDYDAWLATLRSCLNEDGSTNFDALPQACLDVMRHHTSTQERLPILDEFYTTTLASMAPISSVLDLACGLNPLTIPWLPLAPSAHYYACDIYIDLLAFLEQVLQIMQVEGQIFACDLLTIAPTTQVDLALALKILPVLEQVERGASLRLLRTVQARHILVSFPAQSISGRKKGMTEAYETWFQQTIKQEKWHVQRFAFETELAFLIDKSVN